ncbi:hypothetical protein GCM10010201_26280 [Pilimelia columellifera subsp. columellifera]|uniref:Uncharacterized protein n=1 Tax=Pilimelia columellifera subsp. columellifera TaxID=706583 RepID=A0ABP6AWV5_9ACTN
MKVISVTTNGIAGGSMVGHIGWSGQAGSDASAAGDRALAYGGHRPTCRALDQTDQSHAAAGGAR